MEKVVDALNRKQLKINEKLLSHLPLLRQEHIKLTGDYMEKQPASGRFYRLRPVKVAKSKKQP